MIARSYLPIEPRLEPPFVALFLPHYVSLLPLPVLWTCFLSSCFSPTALQASTGPSPSTFSKPHASGNPGLDLGNSQQVLSYDVGISCSRHFSSEVVISQDVSPFKCSCLRRMLRSGTSREIRVGIVPEARESRPVGKGVLSGGALCRCLYPPQVNRYPENTVWFHEQV